MGGHDLRYRRHRLHRLAVDPAPGVAQPASMMQAFVAVRAEGEALIRASGMKATFVRPWYVLGPGPLVALRPSSVLQNRRTASADARIGKASWAHHDFANAPRSRLVGRESG